jgi:hypothetical protein
MIWDFLVAHDRDAAVRHTCRRWNEDYVQFLLFYERLEIARAGFMKTGQNANNAPNRGCL